MYKINIRYISKAITHNQLIQQLVYEYTECTSSIRREGSRKTPLCILSPITSMFLKSDLNLNDNLDIDCEPQLLSFSQFSKKETEIKFLFSLLVKFNLFF